MPDIPNRTALEADLARRFSRLSADHRRKLLTLLGDPPDLGNVPQSFWDDVAGELNGAITPFLTEVWWFSSVAAATANHLVSRVEAWAQKEARREEMEAMTAQNGVGRAQNGQQVNNSNNPVETPQNGSGAPTEQGRDMRAVDLEKWQTKAVKRIKAGRKMDFTFDSDYLDPVTIASIGGALEGAQSEADVKAVFANEWIGYP